MEALTHSFPCLVFFGALCVLFYFLSVMITILQGYFWLGGSLVKFFVCGWMSREKWFYCCKRLLLGCFITSKMSQTFSYYYLRVMPFLFPVLINIWYLLSLLQAPPSHPSLHFFRLSGAIFSQIDISLGKRESSYIFPGNRSESLRGFQLASFSFDFNRAVALL